MEELHQHPDDQTLFDLIEGELEEAHAVQIEAHLDSCDACGDLVRAALAGSPDPVTPGEAMPAAAAETLRTAVRAAWRDRTASIAAREGAHDAEATADGRHLEPIQEPNHASTPFASGASGRSRWLVPALAFIVLAALAGASLQLDDGSGSPRPSAKSAQGNDSAADRAQPESFGAEDDVSAADSASQAARGSGAPAAAPTVGPTGAQASEVGAGAEPAPPRGPDSAPGEVCIATRDDSMLFLPEGRIPQRIVAGPLGSYIVCG